jgi:hypothetical protein
LEALYFEATAGRRCERAKIRLLESPVALIDVHRIGRPKKDKSTYRDARARGYRGQDNPIVKGIRMALKRGGWGLGFGSKRPTAPIGGFTKPNPRVAGQRPKVE